jgi:hypothetical protein
MVRRNLPREVRKARLRSHSPRYLRRDKCRRNFTSTDNGELAEVRPGNFARAATFEATPPHDGDLKYIEIAMRTNLLIAAAGGALLVATPAFAQIQGQQDNILSQVLGAVFGSNEQASEQTLETDWNRGERTEKSRTRCAHRYLRA